MSHIYLISFISLFNFKIDKCHKLCPSSPSQRKLEGHFGDVYSCRFFPSGVVVLTGGADTQVKVWSAESGQCAATLRGHQAGRYLLVNWYIDAPSLIKGNSKIIAQNVLLLRIDSCGRGCCANSMHGSLNMLPIIIHYTSNGR